jgi:hypothetical protein
MSYYGGGSGGGGGYGGGGGGAGRYVAKRGLEVDESYSSTP